MLVFLVVVATMLFSMVVSGFTAMFRKYGMLVSKRSIFAQSFIAFVLLLWVLFLIHSQVA